MAVYDKIDYAANNTWLTIPIWANDSNMGHSGQSEKHSRTNRKTRQTGQYITVARPTTYGSEVKLR